MTATRRPPGAGSVTLTSAGTWRVRVRDGAGRRRCVVHDHPPAFRAFLVDVGRVEAQGVLATRGVDHDLFDQRVDRVHDARHGLDLGLNLFVAMTISGMTRLRADLIRASPV